MREIDATSLYYLAKPFAGQVDHIYLHWSAGWYGQFYNDYHINIDADGTIYLSTDNLTKRLSHTWHRNTRSVGIALACCADASAQADGSIDFGPHPPTQKQIESMAIVVNVLCAALELPMDKEHVMTHYEAAIADGYGIPYGEVVDGVYQGDPDLRWDLWYLPDYINGGLEPGGDMIRGKAAWYREHGY